MVGKEEFRSHLKGNGGEELISGKQGKKEKTGNWEGNPWIPPSLLTG